MGPIDRYCPVPLSITSMYPHGFILQTGVREAGLKTRRT